DRPVVAPFRRDLVVIEVTRQPASGLFHVQRRDITASRVENVARGIATGVDADRRELSLRYAAGRIDAKGDELIALTQIRQRLFGHLRALPLVRIGERQRVGGPIAEPS